MTMLLEALTRPFRKNPEKSEIEQNPLQEANLIITKKLQYLEILQWKEVYSLISQWHDAIQVLYDQCPTLPVGKSLESLLKHAEQQPSFPDVKKKLGLEGELTVHPSWLKHGYIVDVDWKGVDLPLTAKLFLHPKKSNDSTIEIGSHSASIPSETEPYDETTFNVFSMWSGNRGIELLVSSDFWEQGVAGRPHTDYVARLRFYKAKKRKS